MSGGQKTSRTHADRTYRHILLLKMSRMRYRALPAVIRDGDLRYRAARKPIEKLPDAETVFCPHEGMTFRDYCITWKERRLLCRSAHYVESQWRILEAYAFPVMGQLRVADLTKAHITGVLLTARRHGGEHAEKQTATALRSVCRYAAGDYLLSL